LISAEKILEILNETRRKRDEKEIYVTDVTKCLRRAYFSIVRPPIYPSPQMVIGRLLHDAFERLLQKYIQAFFEVSFGFGLGNGWVLKGRCDMLIGDEVYEFKFVRSINKAKENAGYYLQVQFYCYGFRAKRGFLVLIDRETLDMEFVEVSPDAYVAERMIEDAKYLCECLEKKVVPERLSPRFENECQFCDFFESCFRGD